MVLLKIVLFGDEDNMVERLVEIDARVFLDGKLTSRRVFQLTGPGTRKNLGFPGNLHVFTEGLSPTPARNAAVWAEPNSVWESRLSF